MSLQKKIRIGVSLLVRKGEQSLWENGIFQNCLFLAMLLRRSPVVESVVLVAGGSDGGPAEAKRFLEESPVPIIEMAAAMQDLDVMIEMSAQLGKEWVTAFRERGGKVVSMRVGNDYVIDIERMVFGKPNALLITGAPYHEVWTLPEYEATCVPYFASAFRAPTRMLPHIWSPIVLDRALKQLPAGQSFDYQPGRTRWRVGMFEPNICMVKTSYVPMLCCESAHRAAPNVLEQVWAYNTFHLKDQPGFNGFANSLDIVRHGLTSFEGRYPTWHVLATQCDAVVSHHWENAQNYLYYEALYGGYPLIHNSHLIGDCGYRYQGFDCVEGGQALLHAFAEHDAELPAYREKARNFLATLDPESDANVCIYTEAIERLFAD